MSENVKIRIDEYDKTSPSGRGIDSTDIVFIPGFSSEPKAVRDTPTLITSTREFEDKFGKTPFILRESDVEGYSDLNFVAGEPDRSYIYAKELLLKGMPVVYSNITPKDTTSASVLDAFYGTEATIKTQLSTEFIADKSIYSVKYITSGGYPSIRKYDSASFTSAFAQEMLDAAKHRGDAVALIDCFMNPEDKIFSTEEEGAYSSFYYKMQNLAMNFNHGEYGASMYPWATYDCPISMNYEGSKALVISMPASFAYLMCLAKSIKSSPNWLAMAGVSRGLVPAINTLHVPNNVISNFYAEEMQPKFGAENHQISVNTITNIRPYGLTIWGNRTLKPVNKEGTVALNFLNTRNMLSDIKKLLYTTAKSCMFEQNSSDLWIKFKNGIEPLLRRLKAGNGISDYQIVRGTTKYNGDPLTKGEIAAVIKVYPMYAVEYFELAVEINDEDVTIS